MAESEGAPKLSEFYVGIVDLFGIILPGAIITSVVLATTPLREKLDLAASTKFWAGFLAVSYVTGHVISALGGLLFDDVYDNAYKITNKRKKYFRMRSRAKYELNSRFKGSLTSDDNAMEWADVVVRIGSATGAAEIDRLEADSKFFRSLTTVVAIGWPTYIGIEMHFGSRPACICLLGAALGFVPVIAVLALRAYVRAKESRHLVAENGKDQNNATETNDAANRPSPPSNDRTNAQSSSPSDSRSCDQSKSKKEGGLQTSTQLAEEVNNEIVRYQELSSSCETASLVAAGVSVVCIGVSGFALPNHSGFAGIGLAFLGVFSAWRYMERRLKRTTLTYSYVVVLAAEKKEGATEGAARGTSLEKTDNPGEKVS